MKKLALVALLATFTFASQSCSKDDDNEIKYDIKNLTDDFHLSLRLDFVESKTGSDLTNVRVGDILTFAYTIEAEADSAKEEFVIIPDVLDSKKHQIIGKDYNIGKELQRGLIPNVKSLKEINTSDKSGYLYLKVLKPGNFQLVFNILKKDAETNSWIKGTSCELLFNPVRIVAYTYTVQRRRKGNNHHSRWERYHKFFIDCGNQDNDNYLTDLPYTIKLQNIASDEANFIANKHYDFFPSEEYKGGSSPTIHEKMDEIVFTKKINGSNYFISYKNITVTDYARQDKWDDKGNANL